MPQTLFDDLRDWPPSRRFPRLFLLILSIAALTGVGLYHSRSGGTEHRGCGPSSREQHPPDHGGRLRADHLSSYGYVRPTSPVIDRLASEGVRFDQAEVQWPRNLEAS
jgi:hypothetical protein